MKKGLFITFEGCEGSGKSTQARKLFSYLKKNNYRCILTHEPGGTKIAEKIRKILLEKSHTTLSSLAELFLYLASRSQHTEELIIPAIKDGKIVISDRYADSSLAYQGAARQISLTTVRKLNKIATKGYNPNITFLIDIDPNKGLKRLKAKDRIENEEVAFHKKVRKAYVNLSRKEVKRIKLIDGIKAKEEIFREILEIVSSLSWFHGEKFPKKENVR